MDFAFCTAPHRIASSMCHPMAWEALRQGHRVHAINTSYDADSRRWIPSMENTGEEPPADPFLYGHTGLALCSRDNPEMGWHSDWDAAQYDRELWIEKMGEAMWNHEARIITLSEALAEWTSGAMHICPSGADSGPKAFKGICCDRSELGFELPRASRGNALRDDMRVALSRPDAPDAEYRCVFIDGELVASGRYLLDGSLQETQGSPPSVDAFAKEAAAIWLPGSYCVLDVGVKGSRQGIIEYNSLISSGLYQISRTAVVSAIANSWPHRQKPTMASSPRKRPASGL